MNSFWHQVGVLIIQHLTAAGFGGGVLIVAIISSLPPNRPRTLDDWWHFMRESLQTAIPAARHPQSPQSPTQPVDPAQQK